jgi:trimeric autotransporter adhesin
MSSHDFHDPVEMGYNDNLTALVTCLATTFGDEVGQAVNEKINSVLQLEGVDIAAVQAQIATLNSLMQSGNASDAATAQAIVSQLTSLSSRITSLESSTAVAQLTAAVAAIQDAVTTETAARVAADAANAAAIAAVAANVATLTTSLAAVEAAVAAGGTGSCDCDAINTSIAQIVSDVTALKASDASQSATIAGLTTRIQALEVKAGDITAATTAAAAASVAAAAATAAAAAAGAKADAAAAAAAAVAAAVRELDDRNEEQHGHFIHKNEIKDIDCAAVGHAFRVAMRSKLHLS